MSCESNTNQATSQAARLLAESSFAVRQDLRPEEFEYIRGSNSSTESTHENYVKARNKVEDDIELDELAREEDYEPGDEEALLTETVRPSTPHISFPPKAPRQGTLSSFLFRLCSWIQGPRPPRKSQIRPLFARLQKIPIRLAERALTGRTAKILAVSLFHALWAVVFLTVLHTSVAGPEIAGHGRPTRLSCVSRLWSNSTECGLNGDNCRPFNGQGFIFKCPAGCSDVMVLEPYMVGDQEVNYRNLVIGDSPISVANLDGKGFYRGDSFICPAAIHAGVIDNESGGCGILQRTGLQSNFPSVERHGISSIGFASNFPLSFTFESRSSNWGAASTCRDPRWILFAISTICTSVLSLFTTSPSVFFASTYIIVFFQVALASDPPLAPDYDEIVSIGLGRFIPTALAGFVIYCFCVRHTLTDLTAQFEKTILWLGGCWVGALNTDTFDRIPISRLTPHDIQQQPGAIPAVIIIATILIAAAIFQAWCFWLEGRLPRYLVLYGLIALGLTALLLVPGMNLRIHHYILGLILLPGTAVQNRPALLFQGLLVGLFLNGIARWGYDSVLQTPAALLNGATLGSPLPNITTPIITLTPVKESITFEFPFLPADVAGISVQVNDIQRFRGYKPDTLNSTTTGNDKTNLNNGQDLLFEWTRLRPGEPEYFRFAYMKTSALGGVWYEDFSKPKVWLSDGLWVVAASPAS